MRIRPLLWAMFLIPTLFLALAAYAENQVMGEIAFEGDSHIAKTSGVWVDGEYVGYLNELKGSKKILLLPGDHEIVVRQAGYQDFTKNVHIQPGEKQMVEVSMQRAPAWRYPERTAEVKIDVNPSRAAVFVDGAFAGHVGEFKGGERALLIAPGAHRIKIALPGYQIFETDINPLANQKVEIKTDLVENGAPLAQPLLNSEVSQGTSAFVAREK
ncbi:MAG: PEGA domain-containing protein [Terriglobales bacterium]